MNTEPLQCWRCGRTAEDIPMPLPREQRCEACNADLHVCKMCNYYDTGVANACREPVAETVNDKERANFCGYLELNRSAHRGADDAEAIEARRKLAGLFGESVEGLDDGDESLSPAERARRELDDLFK